MPTLWPSPQRSRPDILRIAHRGASAAGSYGPDNLHRLAELGTHLLEFDLRVTADDELVVSHDPEVVGGDGTVLRIAEHPAAELRALGPDTGAEDATEIVVAARDAGLGLYTDLKTATATALARFVEMLQRVDMAARSILASDQRSLVLLCHEIAPDIPRAILYRSLEVDPVGLAQAAHAHFVHPCWEMLERPHESLTADGRMGRLRAHGYGVVTWHEERRPVVDALYDLGVDGVCTDAPALLADVAASSARRRRGDG